MTMKKRITSFALVLLMVLSSLAVLLPVTGVKAAAAGEETAPTGTQTFKKVTSTPKDLTGYYLIVYETGKVAFDASLEEFDVTKNTQAVTITDGTIELDAKYAFYIDGSNGSIKAQTGKGKYIGQTANSNGLTAKETVLTNTITVTDGTATIKSSGGPTLKFNDAKDQMRFRYYKSGQKDIQLYKLEEASEHVHEYNDTWSSDNKYHWHQCIKDSKCTVVDSKAAHTPDTTVSVYKKDTDTANHYFKCATCGEEYSVAHSSATYLPTQDKSQHYQVCDVCNAEFNKGAHNWETDTEATSVPDGKLAQKCSVCGEKRIIATPKEVTIDFTAQGYKDKQAIEKYESDKFLLTFAKGSGSNAPIYYINGTAIRMYSNNTLTIKGVNGEIITKIKITFGNSDGSNEITANGGTFNTDTWTGSANEVVLTIGEKAKNNRRIASIVIEYEAPATEPDTPKIIDSATLNIGTNIDVNYYVVLPEGISYEKYVMRFTFNGKTTNVESTTGDKFTFKNVGPHQMGLNISAVLYGVNGETETKLSEKATYSVKENLESLLTNENETVKTLAKNMLIYGAAAQKYTGAADADLVTSETHTATPNLTTSGLTVDTDTTEKATIKFVGMKLIFDNEPILAIRYEIVSAKYTASDIVFKDENNNVLNHDGEYVYLNSVTANKFGTEVMITNNRDDSAVMLTVNTYIYYILKTSTDANMKALATALYYYGVAAEAYVNAQTTQQ